jgi:hypothetical protein
MCSYTATRVVCCIQCLIIQDRQAEEHKRTLQTLAQRRYSAPTQVYNLVLSMQIMPHAFTQSLSVLAGHIS